MVFIVFGLGNVLRKEYRKFMEKYVLLQNLIGYTLYLSKFLFNWVMISS